MQSKTTRVVSVRNNLSLRHGTDLQGHPITPGEGTPCLKLLCFACFLREVGENSVCTKLVAAKNQKLKSKVTSLTAPEKGPSTSWPLLIPWAGPKSVMSHFAHKGSLALWFCKTYHYQMYPTCQVLLTTGTPCIA